MERESDRRFIELGLRDESYVLPHIRGQFMTGIYHSKWEWGDDGTKL